MESCGIDWWGRQPGREEEWCWNSGTLALWMSPSVEEWWVRTSILTALSVILYQRSQDSCSCLAWLFSHISPRVHYLLAVFPRARHSRSLFLSSDCSIVRISKATELKINTMGRLNKTAVNTVYTMKLSPASSFPTDSGDLSHMSGLSC